MWIKYVGYILPAITAYLFTLGFLYDLLFLFGCGLNGLEFLSDTTTYFTYAFHALLFGFIQKIDFIYFYVAWLIAIASITALMAIKSLRNRLSSIISTLYGKALIAMIFPLFLTLLYYPALFYAELDANAVKGRAKAGYTVLVLSIGEKEIYGSIVRIRNGKVIFFEKGAERPIIVPESNVLEIRYGEWQKARMKAYNKPDAGDGM